MGDTPNVRKVYLIRHGATRMNSEDGGAERIRGWTNVPLSEKGHEQAQQVAKQLKDSGIEILYHSPLSRAADTAKAISETTGAKLVPMDQLKPWDLGEFSGKHSKDVHPLISEYVSEKPNEPVPGGESFNNFKNRAMSGVKEAITANPGAKVGLVTHHRVERLLKAWTRAGQPEDLSINHEEMLKHGEKTGHAEIMHIEPRKLGVIPAEAQPHFVRQLLTAAK